jgi:hypothetical protein
MRTRMTERVVYFLRLGFLGFGCPVALLGQSANSSPTRSGWSMYVALLGLVVADTPAQAQPTIDCKSCPVERKVCRQAHSQQACDSEYAMCLKHCKKT